MVVHETPDRRAVEEAGSTSSPSSNVSSMSVRRSWLTHDRSGAEKDALGRWTISCGSHASAARLRATLPLLPETLSLPVRENAARKTMGSTNGTRTSVDAAMLARSV